MALKATIFKADLMINDMDRNYYQTHNLRLARHPSETDERMMLRLFAFAIHASEYESECGSKHLEFGKGLSADDEPDLWAKDLTGSIECWIDIGQPSQKRINKACGRANKVVVLNHGGSVADIWWEQSQKELMRYKNLHVLAIAPELSKALAKMALRNMSLQCSIQDQTVWLASEDESLELSCIVKLCGGQKVAF